MAVIFPVNESNSTESWIHTASLEQPDWNFTNGKVGVQSIFLDTLGNDTMLDSILDAGNEQIQGTTAACHHFKFIFFTIIVGLLCLLGIIGNSISMFVLHRDKSGGTAKAATYLLQALAVADNAVLIMAFIFLCIIYGLLPYLEAFTALMHLKPYIYKYISSFIHMAQTATVWMTVMLALNRYIAICRPFDTYKRSSKKVARIQVFLVYLFAIVFNFPRFFQYDIIQGTNSANETETKYRETSIGPKSLFGKVYTNGLYTGLVLILPIVILIFLNTKLILELRRMSQRKNIGNQKQNEGNITMTMIIVIVIFIGCNLPDRINEIGKVVHPNRQACSALFIIDCICTALIVFNSSSNFLVYYFFRTRFRQIFLRHVCRCRSSDSELDIYKHNGHHNDVLITCNGQMSRTLATSESML